MSAYDPPTQSVPIFDSALFTQEEASVGTTATIANSVLTTNDNSNQNCFIPFVKTSGTGAKQLFIDSTTTPITINPANGTFNFANAMKVNTDFVGNNFNMSIGLAAGLNNQSGIGAVGIGFRAGRDNQSSNAFAFGYQAGEQSQGQNAVAMGYLAGYQTQGANSIALGIQAAFGTSGGVAQPQGSNAVAIGNAAGQLSQGNNAVSIGYLAGQTSQGANSIAIGNQAGRTSQTAGSIVLNASGNGLNGNQTGIFIDPVRGVDLKIGIGNVFYNSTTKELQYSTTNSKTEDITDIILEMEYLDSITPKTLTFNPSNNNSWVNSTSIATNFAYFGIVKIKANETYNGICLWTAGGITYDYVAYDVGGNGNRLAFNLLGVTTSAGTGFKTLPFDSSITPTTTKNIAIGVSPRATTTLLTLNTGNTNWGKTAVSNTINLLAFTISFNASSGGYSSVWNYTPTASTTKYFLGLY